MHNMHSAHGICGALVLMLQIMEHTLVSYPAWCFVSMAGVGSGTVRVAASSSVTNLKNVLLFNAPICVE